MANYLKSEKLHIFAGSNTAFSPCNINLLFNCIYTIKVWQQKASLVAALNNYTVFFYVKLCLRFASSPAIPTWR